MIHRLLTGAVVIFLAASAGAAIRQISEVERTAVQIVASYLDRGPAAVAENLSSDSPIRSYPDAARAAEIDARMGPIDEAQWELQTVVPSLQERMAAFTVTYPAGFEDHVIFAMKKEGTGYRIHDIRFLAQANPRKPLFELQAQNTLVPAAADAPMAMRNVAAFAGLIAALLAVFSVMFARRRGLSRALLAGACLLATGGALLVVRDEAEKISSAGLVTSGTEATAPALAPLLPLRRVIASGSGDVNAVYAAIDRAGGRGAIADLWKIQSDLLQNENASAKELLAKFPSPSDRPLAEMLRARLAVLDNDEVGAALAFDRAVNLGPGRDAVWLENADLLYALGFEERATAAFRRAAAMGSRDADTYYSLAALDALDKREDEAEKHLRLAWSLRPVERAELFGTGAFWSLVRRPGVSGLIGFSAAGEQVVRADRLSERPITLPAAAQARTSGDFLHVTLGKQQLLVAGGAALAPAGAPVVEASAWQKEERERLLADLPALLPLAGNAAAYAQPALRQRLSGTAEALAERNRWADLVKLTEGLSPASEHVPAPVFFLRSIGLQRLNRASEAQHLLVQVAVSPVLKRRRDPMVLSELAELLAAHDLHDAAVRMYDRSQNLRANPFIDDRVRQIQMNKLLATRYSTHRTRNFEIHYPGDVSAGTAADLGAILESELERLQRWIPTPQFKPVVVNVVWWQDFRNTYTGSEFVLGFYNGKITVPFAGVPTGHPFVKAILGHELAHAMIAQSTGDQAPRWFQEGLAQRVELRPHHENAFNMYDDEHLLPIALLDSVLHGSPDPEMIGAAYVVAQTDIRFFEAKYGKSSLNALMNAFREGATTEEAIERVCTKKMQEIELELRSWGRSERRVFEN